MGTLYLIQLLINQSHVSPGERHRKKGLTLMTAKCLLYVGARRGGAVDIRLRCIPCLR